MIALYRGRSWTSRLIRWINWSDYSHAAWMCEDGAVIEAWSRGGVRYNATAGMLHTPGTVIDIYGIPDLDPARRELIEGWLLRQCGKGYDWHGVIHFLLRKPERPEDRERWFCSELVFAACAANGVELLNRVPAWKVSPGMLMLSPRLVLSHSVTVQPDGNVKICPGPRNASFVRA